MEAAKVLELRRKAGLNQSKFWEALGITQSGGSRYEHGQRIPDPVVQLLRVRYEYGIDLGKITPQTAFTIRAILSGEADAVKLRYRVQAASDLLSKLESVVDAARGL